MIESLGVPYRQPTGLGWCVDNPMGELYKWYTRLMIAYRPQQGRTVRWGRSISECRDERLSLIDRAAAIRGVTRTEFVLRSSEAAAIETLNERPIIALGEEAYDAFVAALDAPVVPNDRLKTQLARRPLWER